MFIDVSIDEYMRHVFDESISIETSIVSDTKETEEIVDICHWHDIPLFIDNFCSTGGYDVRPIMLNADVASGREFVNEVDRGYGSSMGRVAIAGRKCDWSA